MDIYYTSFGIERQIEYIQSISHSIKGSLKKKRKLEESFSFKIIQQHRGWN